jgi:membrane protease subunit (stomatin/prohibitin family)
MSIFKKKNGGFMDVIRCDEPSYLIWKWHPAGSQPGLNSRENAIRWGSSLRVKEGEVAVFVYSQEDGVIHDFIEGPFDQIIETANLPVLASVVGLAYDGASPFHAEVYFINLAKIIQVKFGVPYFDVYDPRFDDFGVPVAVRGTISFSIQNYREFIKLHRLDAFSLETFQAQIKDAVARYIKDVVTNAPSEHNIPVVQIESKIAQINDAIEYTLSERLKENFGVVTSAVDINAIEIDKASVGYQQLMRVTKDVASATVQAEAEAKIKDIHDKQRIDAENYEEMLRIQREEAQYAQHKQTQSANMAAYQVEKQAEVGIAGAQALGQMGSNGGGNVNLSGGDGLNMANMMTSMAIGGAIGQNMAGTINNMMSGMNQPIQGNVTPPPIKTPMYNVAVNGQATGPFDTVTLSRMAASGELLRDS